MDTIHRDLFGELADGVRANGLRMGVFYEMEDYFDFGCSYVLSKAQLCPDNESYVQSMLLPELRELVERYEPDLLYADGDWSGSSDFLGTKPFLAWLFNDSPVKDKVVINDRWGNDTRTKHGGYYVCEYDPTCRFNHSFAVTQGFGLSFGYNRNEEDHPEIYLTSTQLISLLVNASARGGNLEINVGPTPDGRVPASMQERLVAAGDWLQVNGEAIYGTSAVLEGTGCMGSGTAVDPTTCFTRRDNSLFVIVEQWWPVNTVVLPFVKSTPGTAVSLLGSTARVEWTQTTSAVQLTPPNLQPTHLPCAHAWVFMLTNVTWLT